jgi:hypothetical protein
MEQFEYSGLGYADGYADQLGGLGGMDPALIEQALIDPSAMIDRSTMMDPSAMMMPPPAQLSHQVSSQHMSSQSSYPGDLGSMTQPPPPSSHLSHAVSRSSVMPQTSAMREQELRSMQPPLPDPARQDMHAEMFQRLSLRNLNPDGSPGNDDHQQQQHQQRVARAMRPSLTQRPTAPHELGMIESQLSLASDFSAFAGQSGHSLMSLDLASFRRTPSQNAAGNNPNLYGGFSSNEGGRIYFAQQAGAGMSNGGAYSPRHGLSATAGAVNSGGQSAMGATGAAANSSPSPRDRLAGLDRRHVFAKMKYTRPPSVRGPGAGGNSKSPYAAAGNHGTGMSQYSLGDGMPDIHMVESNMSLFSNVSNMTDGVSRLDLESTHDAGNVTSASEPRPLASTSADRSRMPEHNRDINWNGGHHTQGHTGASSVMSLSRIDDASIDNSIFSDMSKKMSNMSTRSVAMSMSEISVLDLQEGENEDEDSGNPEFASRPMENFSAPVQHRRQEYDLS